ncbi:ArsR/SmtB family transcription factor [Paenarthrobacter aurescens]|jgi:DNA-binding transcriptional ArsR family regulator|uniref:Transcriptional regulator, ArsR-family n=1 Tax=Paenarthrobacter aurescens (strain TC1) TaxID=290340 RepID=A1RDI5_PAEAT|nr:metalloregulator ArsR/SmtB family transcription factor [Paenarthrobacter aurescens]ABM10817.1 putative transcriptional regulator, ArsR-family [Paenarthrobacter aurescens TC1]
MQISTQEAFDALADPTRRAILELLAERDELPVGEIATNLGHVGRTAISSHLRILRMSGLVAERRDGRYRYVSLEPDGPVRDAVTFLQALLRSALPADIESVVSLGESESMISDEDARSA